MERTEDETDTVSKMRILVWHLGSSGAGPLFTQKITEGMSNLDRARIYVSYASNSNIHFEKNHQIGIGPLIRTYKSKSGVFLGLPRLLLYSAALRKYIIREEIDLVISPMFSIWQSIALKFALPRSVKYIATVHDSVTHQGDEHWFLDWCVKVDRKRANAFVFLSETVRLNFATQNQMNLPILETVHPVLYSSPSQINNQKRFNSGLSLKTIGFFGYLKQYKGLDTFVEIVGELSNRGIEVNAEIWGKGLEETDQLVRSNPHISWNLGWVEDAEVPNILNRFDILVLPYLEATQSGVLSAAIALGIPVVATPVGGLVEQIESSGIGILSRGIKANDVTDAICEMLVDDELLRICSMRGLEAASKKFPIERVATDYLDFAFRLMRV